VTTPDGDFIPLASGLSYGTPVYLRAEVQSVAHPNADTAPTGTVTFADTYSGPQTPPPVLVPSTPYELNSEGTAIAANGLCALSPGPHSVTASYSGDNSYQPSGPTSPTSLTITQVTPQVDVLPSQSAVAVNSMFTLTVLDGEPDPRRLDYLLYRGVQVVDSDTLALRNAGRSASDHLFVWAALS